MLRKLNKKQLLIGSVLTTLVNSFRNNSMATIIVSLRYCAPGGLHPPSPQREESRKAFVSNSYLSTQFLSEPIYFYW
jgi:hypothetical protein